MKMTSNVRPVGIRWWLMVAVALAVSACGADDPPAGAGPPAPVAGQAVTYVGKVAGADALIAIVVHEGGAVGYSCGRGAALATHTGWYFTELAGPGPEGALRPARSAGGILFTAAITAAEASGTLALPGGTTLAFTAQAVRAGTKAGLYAREEAGVLTGLIVTNDLEAAGNTRISSTLTGGTTSTSVPVRVESSLGGTVTGTITVATPTTPEDVLASTLVELPIVKLPRVIRKDGPVLIILAHGMSHFLDTLPPVRDTPRYSREEWGEDFVRGLLGGPESGPFALYNFLGQEISGPSFLDANLLPRFEVDLPEASIARSRELAAHFVTAEPPAAPGGTAPDLFAPPPAPPRLSLFITFRNSLDGLVASSLRVGNQAYLAIKHYEERFGVTPAVVLVGHSFGGVTWRFVLSNPSATSFLTGTDPPLNADNIPITSRDRARMDHVRDRTIYAVTLGTPHEGSPMADMTIPAQQLLRDYLLQPASSLAGQLLAFHRTLQAIEVVGRENGAGTQFLMEARPWMQGLIRELESPALRDLRARFWRSAHAGPMRPERARRTSASPIVGAQSLLVPIYAIGGRSPGGRVFDSPDLVAGLRRYQQQPEKVKSWISKNMLGGDFLIRIFTGGAGLVNQPVYAGYERLLDRRGRVGDYRTYVGAASDGLADEFPQFVRDLYGGLRRLVLRILLGLETHAINLPVHVDRVWFAEAGGDVELEVPTLVCTDGDRIFDEDVDFQPLLAALAEEYDDIGDGFRAIEGLNLDGILALLGAPADLIEAVITWTTDTLLSVAADSLHCANPVNWKVKMVEREFSGVEWDRTDTTVFDGEIDSDGVVPFSSAMGFSLGSDTPEVLDHRKLEAPGATTFGSWYRYYDSPIEVESHAMQSQHLTGKFLRDELLVGRAGPVARPDGLSAFVVP